MSPARVAQGQKCDRVCVNGTAIFIRVGLILSIFSTFVAIALVSYFPKNI